MPIFHAEMSPLNWLLTAAVALLLSVPPHALAQESGRTHATAARRPSTAVIANGTPVPDVSGLQRRCRRIEGRHLRTTEASFRESYLRGRCDEPREYTVAALDGFRECEVYHTRVHDPFARSLCRTEAQITAFRREGYRECHAYFLARQSFYPHGSCDSAAAIARFQLPGFRECYAFHQSQDLMVPESSCENPAEIARGLNTRYQACVRFYRGDVGDHFGDRRCIDESAWELVETEGFRQCYIDRQVRSSGDETAEEYCSSPGHLKRYVPVDADSADTAAD